MNDFLKAEPVPAYLAASFRTFSPGEFHVTRNAPYSVLLLLMKGTLRFEEDGISVEVKAGEYYIQRAGLTQHARQPSDMPHYFYIHFSGAYGTAADGSIPLRGGWNPQPLETVLQELDRLERLSLGRAFGKQALFFEVLDQLSRGLKNESGTEDLVRRTEAYLSAHFQEPVKMENLEEALNYSRDYLTRSFQRDRGMTPHRYLTMLRIGHAKWMLANTACSVREIAEACGYADLSVFNRAFRALTGRTPTQWQKENR